MSAHNNNELIDKLEAILEYYTRMEESFRDSNHFAHRIRDELGEIRENGFYDQAVYDMASKLDEILEKTDKLNKIIDSEKSNLENSIQVIESYHSCVYGPPF